MLKEEGGGAVVVEEEDGARLARDIYFVCMFLVVGRRLFDGK